MAKKKIWMSDVGRTRSVEIDIGAQFDKEFGDLEAVLFDTS